MKRSLLRALAGTLVGVLLTAQISIAAYACPALLSPSATNMQMPPVPPASAWLDERSSAKAGMPMAQMSDCDDMAGGPEASYPNLCAEHCKYGQQSDQAPTVNVPVAVLSALYAISPVPVLAPSPRPTAATMNALVAASPPHTLTHCVFRI